MSRVPGMVALFVGRTIKTRYLYLPLGLIGPIAVLHAPGQWKIKPSPMFISAKMCPPCTAYFALDS